MKPPIARTFLLLRKDSYRYLNGKKLILKRMRIGWRVRQGPFIGFRLKTQRWIKANFFSWFFDKGSIKLLFSDVDTHKKSRYFFHMNKFKWQRDLVLPLRDTQIGFLVFFISHFEQNLYSNAFDNFIFVYFSVHMIKIIIILIFTLSSLPQTIYTSLFI